VLIPIDRHKSSLRMSQHTLEDVVHCMQVLHANLASLSGTKTLPYLVMFLTSNLGGWAGDYLISQRVTSTAGGRKTINTIGTLLH